MTRAALSRLSWHTINGFGMRTSGWHAAHLKYTIARLAKEHPGARLQIIQGTFSDGVYSAGTHDKDMVDDVRILGMPGKTEKDRWWAGQKFLRRCGWAAWFRHTGTWLKQSAWHFHIISIPPGLKGRPSLAQVVAAFKNLGVQVGEYVPAQVVDYFRHTFGLKNQHNPDADKSWFPRNISSTIFKEDKVAALRTDIKALAADHGVTLAYVARVALSTAIQTGKPKGDRLARIKAAYDRIKVLK